MLTQDTYEKHKKPERHLVPSDDIRQFYRKFKFNSIKALKVCPFFLLIVLSLNKVFILLDF